MTQSADDEAVTDRSSREKVVALCNVTLSGLRYFDSFYVRVSAQ